MMLKKISALLLVVCFLAGCLEKIPNPFEGQKLVVKKIGTSGGTVVLSDFGTVEIPSGTFNETVSIKVSQTNEPATSNVFSLTKALFGINNWVGYEIRVNSASVKPQTEITVRLTVPQSFANSIQISEGIESFVMIYYDGGNEIHDDFSIINSVYIPQQNEIRFTLSSNSFTNNRTTDHSYEAVMTIAAVPGVNNVNSSFDNSCGGQFISCMVDNCLTAVSKSFNSSTGHSGTDFSTSTGDVKAASNGKGILLGNDTRTSPDGKQIGWGQFAIVENVNSSGQRFANLYAHLGSFSIGSKTTYSSGEREIPTNLNVNEGQLIGNVSASSKLHFEYVSNGNIADHTSKKNPEEFIQNQSIPRLLNTSIEANGSLNDCEYPAGVLNAGTSYHVNVTFSDIMGEVNNNAVLFLQDAEPYSSNPYSVLLTNLNTGTGTASTPDLCIKFGNSTHKRIRAYLKLANGKESNCVYVTIIKPAGAL
jgi:hypothetical protein